MRADHAAPAIAYDEALEADGRPRPHATAALTAVRRRGPDALAAAVRETLRGQGVGFASVSGNADFRVDAVPRVLPAEEWDGLEAGLLQRVRALDAFVADVYGPQRIVTEGVMPARVIESAEYFEPRLRGTRPPGGTWIGVAGLDVVREPSGAFRVLEDNLRTPSGLGYLAAARAAVLPELAPELDGEAAPRPVDVVSGLLADTLRAAAPPAAADSEARPRMAIVSDGPGNAAYWEHGWLAERMGIPLLTPAELEVRGDALHRRDHDEALDVVYRRTDADRLDTHIGALLDGPWRAGRLGLVNAFGTGVADDKLAHAYVEEMVRFYLGEEPLIDSVPTYDLGVPGALERALDELDSLVVKPRAGYGGMGVVVVAHARPADVEALRRAMRADPEAFIAQELVLLSTHPTICAGGLAPRHVDLRPFVFTGPAGEPRVLPGGLTRVAFGEGALVVNSSQDGGAKDTWVLPA